MGPGAVRFWVIIFSRLACFVALLMALPATAVSIFGGEAESFPSSAMQVELWGKATNLDA